MIDAQKLHSQVRAFIADDPDETTRDALQRLLDLNQLSELQSLFAAPLAFGTAGLRGLLGSGPGRMNLYVVERTTAGLCAYVQQHVANAEQRGLCIGYDARHQSQRFAHAAASIALAMGLRVRLFCHARPTPLLAFAVRHCNAAAGVMITASHNPPAYNGYKVYNEHGAQIVEPQDAQISDCIHNIRSVRELARLPLEEAGKRLIPLAEGIKAQYLAAITQPLPVLATAPPLRVAYSALHGVGGELCLAALRQAGFANLHVVEEQQAPNPDFPTTPFPNPEEPKTLDHLRDLAKAIQADIALANDPDADRLAVVIRDEAGAWVTLTGNEVGVLLCDFMLTHDKGGAQRAQPLVAYSLVSTPMIARTAQAHGAFALQTLTGFKWICNEALAMERKGYRFVFGFEEALGYAMGHAVLDKDGIAAALAMATLAAQEQERGRTLWDLLGDLSRRDGCYVSGQVSHHFHDPEDAKLANSALAQLRAEPPATIGDHAIVSIVDLQSGVETTAAGERTSVDLPKSNVLVINLQGHARVCIRPSGTEPKLKLYFDACVTMRDHENFADARKRARSILKKVQLQALPLLNLPHTDA